MLKLGLNYIKYILFIYLLIGEDILLKHDQLLQWEKASVTSFLEELLFLLFSPKNIDNTASFTVL